MLGLIKEALGLDPASRLRHFGLLAEFESPHELYEACEKVRDQGYTRWDAHAPFPVHGLDEAMGLPPSRIPWIVLVGGLTGSTGALALQWWVSASAYRLVISGKPFFSWPAFIPIIFELGVLLGSLSALLGMFALNQLPQLYHSLFRSERFERVTDDRFFISIEASDPKFHEADTARMLESLGASHVELVER